jgi:glycosyltransferase involved in cell wall biosynthesis
LFLGHCDREQLAGLYRAADVFVHPNPNEPFGIAPIEAMAAGLPVVAPDSGGLLTYANRENAWLTSPNGSAFVEAIRNVVQYPGATRQKTARARETAASFSWRHATQRYFELYDRLHSCYVSELRPERSRAISEQRWSSDVSQ